MKRRNFSPEFKRESAHLVADQNYTVSDAAEAMDISLCAVTKWAKQLRDEHKAKRQPDNAGTNQNTLAKEKTTTHRNEK